MFFNEQGILKIDEVVMNHPSWKKIMEDRIVTDEELYEQVEKVTELLHKVDETFSAEQKQIVNDLLAEVSVLFAVHHVYQLQEMIKK